MQDTLDLPTIDTAALDTKPAPAANNASELIDRAEIKGGNVLVAYSRTEAALVDLRNRFKGATFDLTTTVGDKAARGARLELVTLRTGLEKKRKEFKTPALEFGRRIDAEAARITGEIEALEKPIDDQIKADEHRRAEEKAEKDRIEAERVAKHNAGIAKIRGYAAAAQGLPSERIAKGVAALEAMAFGPEWEEFAVQAANAQCETIDALKGILAKTIAAEEAAEKARLDQIELDRLRAEQVARDAIAQQVKTLNAMVAASFSADAADISARVDMLACTVYSEDVAAEVLATHETVLGQMRKLLEVARKQEADAAELAALRAAQAPAPEAPPVEPAPRPVAMAGSPAAADPHKHLGVDFVVSPPAAPADTRPPITTGTLCARFGDGFTLTAQFIAGLGFTPAERPKDAKSGTYWAEADFGPICMALAKRCEAMGAAS